MGPIILLDKSTFQSLSHDQVGFLFKHYMVCIPPVLIMEIMGDISKPPRPGNFKQNDAQWLAQKIEAGDSGISASCREMVAAALLGQSIPMTGQIPMDTGVRVPNPGGGYGVIFEEHPARKALRNWAAGNFSDFDRNASQSLRETIHSFDLENFKKRNPPIAEEVKRIKTVGDVLSLVDMLLDSDEPDAKLANLNRCLGMFNAAEPLKTAVSNRWVQAGMPKLNKFAPYAAFCYRAYTAFIIGLSTGVFSTRSSNVVDLEYVWYLPFCWIFASSDNFHKLLVPLLLRADQEFVAGEVLKEDLKNIGDEWQRLDEQGREERRIHFGAYPPELEGSFSYRMSKKYCKPRTPYCGDPLAKFPEKQRKEMERKIVEEINRKFEPYRRMKGD